jgi:transformation/transcription domain-associated protein
MLADLIHHVRADLTLPQLARVVHTYSANIHDPTLAPSIQTMCSKLLLNLIDPISSKEPVEAGKVLHRILAAFVSKMEGMAEVRDEWVKWSRPREYIVATLAALAARDARVKEQAEAEARKKLDAEGEGRITEVAMDEDQPTAKVSEGVSTKVATPVVDGKDKAPVDKVPVELDEVDIERAKPIGRIIVMVEPGPDPVKGILSRLE